MITYLTQRLVQAAGVLLGVSIITFLLAFLLPADPDLAAECDIVLSRNGGAPPTLEPVVSLAEMTRMVEISASVRLDPQLVQYAVTLVAATRQMADLRLGASPRGSIGLLRASQSLAAAEGRTYAITDDVKRLAVPVLAHRLLVAPDAQLRGVTAERIITELLGRVMAATLLGSLPVLILYLLAQRQFISGVAMSGLKG